MSTIDCERPTCDSWAIADHALAAGFVTATSQDGEWHYCGWDCLMKDAARITPPTVID